MNAELLEDIENSNPRNYVLSAIENGASVSAENPMQIDSSNSGNKSEPGPMIKLQQVEFFQSFEPPARNNSQQFENTFTVIQSSVVSVCEPKPKAATLVESINLKN